MVEPLEPRRLLSATLLVDANTDTKDSLPGPACDLGGVAVFYADDGIHGAELWRTDGTGNGTSLLKDILPGSQGSTLTDFYGPVYPTLVVWGTGAAFVADDGVHGPEVWVTDGTVAGTRMMVDLKQGFAGSDPTQLVVANGKLYFIADDGIEGRELWVADSANSPARRLTVLPKPGVGEPIYGPVVPWQSGVAFVARGPDGSFHQLWRTDGTVGNTIAMPELTPGLNVSGAQMRSAGRGPLYFTADESGSPYHQMWRTDGTPSGTFRLRSSVATDSTNYFAVVGQSVYFNSTPGSQNTGLFVSDGTVAGTRELAGAFKDPFQIEAAGNRITFAAQNGGPGSSRFYMWYTDGTDAGTFAIRDAVTGEQAESWSSWFEWRGNVYGSDIEGLSGRAIWRTDGTPSGTTKAAILPSFAGSSVFGSSLLFRGYSSATGDELWLTDLTLSVTRQVADINTNTRDGAGFAGTALGADFYFPAGHSSTGVELWKHDGSQGTTGLVHEVEPGTLNGLFPNVPMVAWNDHIYYATRPNPAGPGFDLWKRGPHGPVRIALLPGTPSRFVVSGDFLYFYVAGSPLLWRTDGTASGTSSMPSQSTSVETLVATDRTLFQSGNGLWAIDAGTTTPRLVIDLGTGRNPQRLMPAGRRLFFSADRGPGSPLADFYVTDGTASGTTALTSAMPGALGAAITLDNRLYFVHTDQSGNRRLCISDGTVGGTSAINNAAVFANTLLGAHAGFVYFTGNDGHLWRTNGTDVTKVAAITPVFANGIQPYVSAGPWLFVRANDPLGQVALYRTDGTTSGTLLVNDLTTGESLRNPRLVGASSRAVFIQASTSRFGTEMWQVPFPTTSVATVRGRAVWDQDGDGQPGSLETGVAGRTIYVDVDGDKVQDPGEPATITDALGHYRFTDLLPGTLTLRMAQVAGTVQVSPLAGAGLTVVLGPGTPFNNADFSVAGAVTGGPFGIDEGAVMSLSATGSAVGAASDYEWDFDLDASGFQVDATGRTPVYSAILLDGPGSRVIGVRVRNALGQWSAVASTTVTLNNIAPRATFAAGAAVSLGTPSTVSFTSPTDPSAADTAAGFLYSFDFNNDGDFADVSDVAGSTVATAGYAYPSAGTYPVRGRIADKDGGYTDATVTVTVNPPPPPPTTIKVNFQPAAAPTVAGYLVDAGLSYAARNGQAYGWSANHADVVFDRNKNSNQLLDTNVGVKAGGRWEIAVPNGTYTVKVGVGDSGATSKNNVYVEGKLLFNYQSLSANGFASKSISVPVTDGKLTIGVGGSAAGATRIDFVEVTPPSSPPPPPPPPTTGGVKVNFQPSAAPTVAGYLIDAGHTYAARNGRTYGWITSHTDVVVDRNLNANQLLDTNVAVKAGGKWEIAVPNGTYTVKVTVGDAGGTSKNNVYIEGKVLFNYQSLAANVFSTKSIAVAVADGKLTLGIGGSTSGLTKINSIEIA